MSRELPSFDLVVATVGRSDELGLLLDSIEAQGLDGIRVLLVDQNEDEDLAIFDVDRRVEVQRRHAERGLSRARNAVLHELRADVVAFPDDDCAYPPSLLARVAERLAADPVLDGVVGRTEDAHGRSSSSWKADRAILTSANLWNRANAATIFLRRQVVERVGPFDERLGLGSGEAWSSGEEIDYLIRAVREGACIEYDPTLVVQHPVRENDSPVGARDGASVGYLLRKHRYPRRTVARMLARPLSGAVVSLATLDGATARYRLATFRGRVRGYREASRSKSSA